MSKTAVFPYNLWRVLFQNLCILCIISLIFHVFILLFVCNKYMQSSPFFITIFTPGLLTNIFVCQIETHLKGFYYQYQTRNIKIRILWETIIVWTSRVIRVYYRAISDNPCNMVKATQSGQKSSKKCIFILGRPMHIIREHDHRLELQKSWILGCCDNVAGVPTNPAYTCISYFEHDVLNLFFYYFSSNW